jgi:hypothetical protein
MGFSTLSLGLTLTIPTNGTKNWGSTLLNSGWKKISQHQHTGSGDGNRMVTASYTDNSVTTAKLAKNIGVTQAATVTPAGTTQTLDLNLGNVQKVDLTSATGDVTLTLSNPAQGHTYRVLSVQAATPRDLIWPANVKWPGGQKPLLSQTAGQVDKIELYYDGTNFLGDWDLNYS